MVAASAQSIGWVDQVSCSTVSGWAANRATPTQPVSVFIFDGATFLGSVVANGSRPDTVGAVGGGSVGNHGFAFSLPASVHGLYKVPVSGGVGSVVYEIFQTGVFEQEEVQVPVYLAYAANSVAAGTANMTFHLAPLSTSFVSTLTGPIPRFKELVRDSLTFTIQPCGQ